MSSGNWGPNHRNSLEFLGWFAGIIHMTDPNLERGDWITIQKLLAEYIQQGVTPDVLVNSHTVIDSYLNRGQVIKGSSNQWVVNAHLIRKYDLRDDADVFSGVTHNIDMKRLSAKIGTQVDLRFTKAKGINHQQVKMIRRGWSMLRATRVMRRDGNKVRSWHATADAFLALMLLGRTARAYDLITSRWSNCTWTANDL